jgi:lathosterol oxidase
VGIKETPLNQFVSLMIGGLTTYFCVSGLSYLIFFVWGRKRFHPTYQPNPAENRTAIKWGVIGSIGNIVLVMPFLLMQKSYSKVYWDVRDHGFCWLIASFFLYLAFTETCIYWTHRALHTDFLYHRLHKYHHQWRVPTSWASMAFHPLDSFAQALPHHIIGFLLPLHGLIYLTMLSFVSVWSVMIHDRVSFVKWNVINYADHHTLHHWFCRYNYGQFFTWWDHWGGTYRDPELAASEDNIPEGVLR